MYYVFLSARLRILTLKWIIERGARESIMPLAIRAAKVKTAPVHASTNCYLENVLPILQRSVWLASVSSFGCRIDYGD